MGKELTVPQLLLLADISERPETVNETYRPAKRLVELGYANITHGPYGSASITITNAGREALASRLRSEAR